LLDSTDFWLSALAYGAMAAALLAGRQALAAFIADLLSPYRPKIWVEALQRPARRTVALPRRLLPAGRSVAGPMRRTGQSCAGAGQGQGR
jgi:hypothetical protein